MARLREGSARARANSIVEASYLEHAAAVERHARALAHDAGVAEDVVQEAFARLHAEVLAGRVPDHPGAWLHRVAANLVTSRGRRLAVAERHLARLHQDEPAPSTESLVLEGERSRDIRQALATLPTAARRAVVLAALGYGGPEIAAQIGRTHGATRTLLCRARSRLRDELIAAGAA